MTLLQFAESKEKFLICFSQTHQQRLMIGSSNFTVPFFDNLQRLVGFFQGL